MKFKKGSEITDAKLEVNPSLRSQFDSKDRASRLEEEEEESGDKEGRHIFKPAFPPNRKITVHVSKRRLERWPDLQRMGQNPLKKLNPTHGVLRKREKKRARGKKA